MIWWDRREDADAGRRVARGHSWSMRDFKRLHVWQRAHAAAVTIHDRARGVSGRDFVTLRSQLTRAADSIATNLVEGCGSASQREFARYLDIAIKSANETEYHLIVAADRGALDASDAALLAPR